jgi:hypothetical protein
MMILVAGPYSADTEAERARNLDEMNDAAAAVHRLGHTPVIGVNAARAVADRFPEDERYDVIMRISLALAERCDAILLIAPSPGALRERDLVVARGRPCFTSVSEIPRATV